MRTMGARKMRTGCHQCAGSRAEQEHLSGDLGPDPASAEAHHRAAADPKSASAGGSPRRRASHAGTGEPTARRAAVTPFLLDVNVLIAPLDPTHTQHDAAHDWFEREGHKAWATCPLAEYGVVRIVGQARYLNSPAQLDDRLAQPARPRVLARRHQPLLEA